MKINVASTTGRWRETYDKFIVDLNALSESQKHVGDVFIHSGTDTLKYNNGVMYFVTTGLHKLANLDNLSQYILVSDNVYEMIQENIAGYSLDLNGIYVKNATAGWITANNDPTVIRATIGSDGSISVVNYIDVETTTETVSYADASTTTTDVLTVPFVAESRYSAPNVKITRESINNAILPHKFSFAEFMTAVNNGGKTFEMEIRPMPPAKVGGENMNQADYVITAYASVYRDIELNFSQNVYYNEAWTNKITLNATSFGDNGIATVSVYFANYTDVFNTSVTLDHVVYSLPQSKFGGLISAEVGDCGGTEGGGLSYRLVDTKDFKIGCSTDDYGKYASIWCDSTASGSEAFTFYTDHPDYYKVRVWLNGLEVTENCEVGLKFGYLVIWDNNPLIPDSENIYRVKFEQIKALPGQTDFIPKNVFKMTFSATDPLPADSISVGLTVIKNIPVEAIPSDGYRIYCSSNSNWYKYTTGNTQNSVTGYFRLENV